MSMPSNQYVVTSDITSQEAAAYIAKLIASTESTRIVGRVFDFFANFDAKKRAEVVNAKINDMPLYFHAIDVQDVDLIKMMISWGADPAALYLDVDVFEYMIANDDFWKDLRRDGQLIFDKAQAIAALVKMLQAQMGSALWLKPSPIAQVRLIAAVRGDDIANFVAEFAEIDLFLLASREVDKEALARIEKCKLRIFGASDPSIFDDCDDLPPPAKGISVCIYDRADIAKLTEKARGASDREGEQRIKMVVERLRAVGNVRPLAQLPEDWKEKVNKLAKDFPNFSEFTDFLLTQFALSSIGDARVYWPAILFDGRPGVGKTEIAMTLAEMFYVDLVSIDMSTAQSSSALSGSETFWSNTAHGRLFETLCCSDRTANPIVFLDELDKVLTDRYAPDAPLLQLLEKRTAEHWHDLSFPELKLDASHVLWIAATNDLNQVSAPVLSRFRVFKIDAPDREQTMIIAKLIYAKMLVGNHWGSAMHPALSDKIVEILAASTPREIKSQLLSACGRAVLDGRRELRIDDFKNLSVPKKQSMGFGN